ncbi:MAG: hypothetical protein ABII97_00150 [Patescibacteria group bacterium]
MIQEGHFEQGLTPQQEIEGLRKRAMESPEKTPEILKEHFAQAPEQVYAPGYLPSPEDVARMEQKVVDAHYQEKENAIKYLFEIVKEKGALNAAGIAKKLDPALQDEFHDRLVFYLRQTGEL